MYSFLIENNEGIRNFLKGDDTCIPISEVKYLHSRPLIRPNFITEIEDLISKVAVKIGRTKLSGKPIQDLSAYAIELGVSLGREMDDTSAKEVALSLRKIYKLCLDLDSKI